MGERKKDRQRENARKTETMDIIHQRHKQPNLIYLLLLYEYYMNKSRKLNIGNRMVIIINNYYFIPGPHNKIYTFLTKVEIVGGHR